VLAVEEILPPTVRWPPQVTATRDFQSCGGLENGKLGSRLSEKDREFQGRRNVLVEDKTQKFHQFEKASDFRAWYRESNKHGYLANDDTSKLKISEIREVEDGREGAN